MIRKTDNLDCKRWKFVLLHIVRALESMIVILSFLYLKSSNDMYSRILFSEWLDK